MSDPTLLQLQCFAALVAEGSFSAAATALHRTHPTVHSAIKSLEEQLGLVLLDRSKYRVELTEQGRIFHARTELFLREYAELKRGAAHLAADEEPELRIVVGDLCPLPATLGRIQPFFTSHPHTRLTLMHEAIAGPWERLAQGECDLIFHHQDQPSPRFESIELFSVRLVPVAAPGFVRPGADMRALTQCVIRDSSSHPAASSYYLVDGARTCSVPDQAMKRELIVQGLAWGHMPLHLVADDIIKGRLQSLEGPSLAGATLRHFATRRRNFAHGPVARKLWNHLRQQEQSGA